MTLNSEEEHTVYLLLTQRVTKAGVGLRWQQQKYRSRSALAGPVGHRQLEQAREQSGEATTAEALNTINLPHSTYLRPLPGRWSNTAPPLSATGSLPCYRAPTELFILWVHPISVWIFYMMFFTLIWFHNKKLNVLTMVLHAKTILSSGGIIILTKTIYEVG